MGHEQHGQHGQRQGPCLSARPDRDELTNIEQGR